MGTIEPLDTSEGEELGRRPKKRKKQAKKKLTPRKMAKNSVLVFQVTAVTDRLNIFDFGSCTFDT